MASITLKHIQKVYPGGVKVIEDLNLEIQDREFIVLVGPSGCGKSTTLRMIAGLEEVSGGELYIGDRLVNEVVPKERDIAMVFQNYALYPHMTVYKNMAFALKLRKTDKDLIDQKVHEAARILDIEHLLNRKPRALSGGQRQRVALGRAMVRDPKVFLLDEPLSNLDAKLRTQMRTEITKLHKRLQTTFVYVTHDQTEAMTMGDRIVVMKEGIIQQVDTPQNLYDAPCNLFVAGFIGSPQMNFMDAQVRLREGKYVVALGPYELPVSPEKQAALEGYDGKNVTLGIRPEDFHAEGPLLADGDCVVEMQVDIAELMGADTYFHGACAGTQLNVRAPSHIHAPAGSLLRLAVDCKKMHLFDQESQQAILN